MPRYAIRFLAGRYHATPWGRHVNEGAIEWPPSPWRLTRALLATGFSKLGWSDVPALAAQLFAALAEHPPVFSLPPVTVGHMRHFMPVGSGKPDKVLDAFAWIGREEVLRLEWPVALSPEAEHLLDDLFLNLTFLGRAESWVEVQLDLTGSPLESTCEVADAAPRAGLEAVRSLAPLPEPAYLDWRAAQVERALDHALERARAAAAAKGTKSPVKLKKDQRVKVEAAFPTTGIAALRSGTRALQKQGWSQPPGTHWVSYWRPAGCLSQRPAVPRRAAPRPLLPQFALLSLCPDTVRAAALPSLRRALLQAEALHGAWARQLHGQTGSSALGRSPEGQPSAGHQHASLLPYCSRSDQVAGGNRAVIDRVLVCVPAGINPEALRALRQVRLTFSRKLPRAHVDLIGVGSSADLAGKLVRHLARSTAWVSYTPFVPPRHLKSSGKNDLRGQIEAELESRYGPTWPRLRSVEVEIDAPSAADRRYVPASSFWDVWRARASAVRLASAGTEATSLPAPPRRLATHWRNYCLKRGEGKPQPPRELGLGLRLVFEEPIEGPLSLGYASHFGLGQFLPITKP